MKSRLVPQSTHGPKTPIARRPAAHLGAGGLTPTNSGLPIAFPAGPIACLGEPNRRPLRGPADDFGGGDASSKHAVLAQVEDHNRDLLQRSKSVELRPWRVSSFGGSSRQSTKDTSSPVVIVTPPGGGHTPEELGDELHASHSANFSTKLGSDGCSFSSRVPDDGKLRRSQSFSAGTTQSHYPTAGNNGSAGTGLCDDFTLPIPTPPSVALQLGSRRRSAAVVLLQDPLDLDVAFPPITTPDSPSFGNASHPGTPMHVVHVVRSRRSSNASTVGDASDENGTPSTTYLLGAADGARRRSTTSSAAIKADRLEARNALMAAEMQAKEEAVMRRSVQLDPRTTLARRWSETVIFATACRVWHCRIEVARRQRAAAAVLHRRVVPMWRAWRTRRRVRSIMILHRFILKWVARVRIAKRARAADLIVKFLRFRAGMLMRCVAGLRNRVVLLQRATRLFLKRRAAQVEAHLRLIRPANTNGECTRGIEAEYWGTHVGRRSGFYDKASWLAHGGSLPGPRLPESVIRRRLIVAISAAARKYHRDVRAWETEVGFISVQQGSTGVELRNSVGARRESVALRPEDRRASTLSQLSRLRRPFMRCLLSKEALFAVLDQACRTTAALQNDSRWTAHLS